MQLGSAFAPMGSASALGLELDYTHTRTSWSWGYRVGLHTYADLLEWVRVGLHTYADLLECLCEQVHIFHFHLNLYERLRSRTSGREVGLLTIDVDD